MFPLIEYKIKGMPIPITPQIIPSADEKIYPISSLSTYLLKSQKLAQKIVLHKLNAKPNNNVSPNKVF